LLVWVAFGALAYGVAVGADALSTRWTWAMDNATRASAILVVAAGVYQLSPLKNLCLSKCRSPLSFIMTSWRDGRAGAFRMGLEHGMYCLGCCWLLFVILFPIGLMNIGAMVALTLLIFAEKSLPIGTIIGRVVGAALILYGALVFFVPQALPGMSDVIDETWAYRPALGRGYRSKTGQTGRARRPVLRPHRARKS